MAKTNELDTNLEWMKLYTARTILQKLQGI